MGGIVCAVRGGPDSRDTIETSINLAKKTSLPLHFLYVVNLDFLSHTTRSSSDTVAEQMKQMGEFILLSAQESADAEGVHPNGIIRQGPVKECIINVCHEVEADYLVLGRPAVHGKNTIFSHEKLEALIKEFEEKSGAEVVLPGLEEA
ncbi:MAG: universal stress protein [Anaerolineales bacterium]|nr:universal stress protein [Anaerolineales bacterium]